MKEKYCLDTRALQEKKKHTPDFLPLSPVQRKDQQRKIKRCFLLLFFSRSIFISHYSHRGTVRGDKVFMMSFFFFLGTIDV